MAILIRKGIDWRERKLCIDPDGRFVVVSGVLSGKLVVLAAMYGLNADEPEFFRAVCARITMMDCATIIWGVDFNVVLNDSLDRRGAS